MTSKATRRFWRLFQELPLTIQRLSTSFGANTPVTLRLISKN